MENLLRENIKKLLPYSSARDEYTGTEGVFLDANENPFESGLNRYPDPYQKLLKSKLASIKKVNPEQVLLGNGSDEVIDLIFRAFCEPKKDNVILLPPTYGMYKVSAAIQDVEVIEVPLDQKFQIEPLTVLNAVTPYTKVIFFCSPNNPSGNCISSDTILNVLKQFKGIVVIDEAYIDFCPEKTLVSLLNQFPRLIIMQTLSKAWGLAGLRIGIMLASKEIIAVMNKIKPPYNINVLSQQAAINAMEKEAEKQLSVNEILRQKAFLISELEKIKAVKTIYPSDANFLLVKFEKANELFGFLIGNKVIVRNRSMVIRCEDCLRITIGTSIENLRLLEAIRLYYGDTKKDFV